MPDGYPTYAEMGNGNTTARAGIELDLKDSFSRFNVAHMNQDGVAQPAGSSSPATSAGVYQLTPLKNACLRNCRAPAHFLSRYCAPATSAPSAWD